MEFETLNRDITGCGSIQDYDFSHAIGWHLAFACVAATLMTDGRGEFIARIWNEQNLAAIRIDSPNPPVHSRNLFHVSVAMWDAWAAYDADAAGYLHREAATAEDVALARREAISYAAYRLLAHRYALSVSAESSMHALADQMETLNYDPAVITTEGPSPAALGNRVAAAVLAFAATDQSNETSNYTDPTYVPANEPLLVDFAGTTITNPNRWQPLAFAVRITQNGLIASQIQTFIGSHWGSVRPFAMSLTEGNNVFFDPGTPPMLGPETDPVFKDGNFTVIRNSSFLDPANGDMIDISPAGRGNNSLGSNDGSGRPLNSTTNKPYEPEIVPHGDFGRVAADEAGLSRIYGGIHVPVDDGPARIVGSQCGIGAWELAKKYFDGSILDERPAPAIAHDGQGGFNIRWNSRRGLFYELQSSATVDGVYTGAGSTRAEETSMQSTTMSDFGESMKFYRVVQQPNSTN